MKDGSTPKRRSIFFVPITGRLHQNKALFMLTVVPHTESYQEKLQRRLSYKFILVLPVNIVDNKIIDVLSYYSSRDMILQIYFKLSKGHPEKTWYPIMEKVKFCLADSFRQRGTPP